MPQRRWDLFSHIWPRYNYVFPSESQCRKLDTTTCAAFILMIKFCFNESFHWTCNWLVLKALRYHLISTCMFELLIQMVQKEMEPALCWQTKCFWENNRSFTTYRSLWETQEEGATTWVGPALWPLKSETKTTISTLMDTRRSLFTTTKVWKTDACTNRELYQ